MFPSRPIKISSQIKLAVSFYLCIFQSTLLRNIVSSGIDVQWLQKILNTFYSASQPRIARFFFTNIYIYKAILSVHFVSFTLSFPPIRLTLSANYPTCFNLLSSLKLSLVRLSHIFLFAFALLLCTPSSYSTIFLPYLSPATSSNPDIFYVFLCPVSR